jgi:hypothetical protein
MTRATSRDPRSAGATVSPYAEKTTVTTERSRTEIEQILRRYGASMFAYGWKDEQAVVEFAANGRRIRFVLPLPSKDDRAFGFKLEQYSHARIPVSATEREKRWEQACRQRWRALALAIKAKLESVESQIATFEDEFLAYTVLPDGQTASEWMQPQINRAYESGEMPSVLPALGSGS